jgi:hypothetical protein
MSIEQQIIRKEVEEKLKDLAGQIGQKLGEQQALIGKVIQAMQGLSSSLVDLEARVKKAEEGKTEVRGPSDPGREL